MKKAVVLLSGGLDSTTVLKLALDEGYEVYALTVNYGQKHEKELLSAKNIAQAYQVAEHKIAYVSLNAFGGSALTDDIDVPKDGVEDGIPVTYVPARNLMLLSVALAWAETLGACDLFIGANHVDYSGYPDCRPEFIRSFEETANLATKIGVEGAKVQVHAPLMEMTKPEIIQLGLEHQVDYAMTHSCYDPDEMNQACGLCDACRIRADAFLKLGLDDPALEHLVSE